MNYIISVIMPLLNGNLTHLSQSIESILTQSFKEFEFLIIDDGSNQETKSLIASYADRDERIKIITNEENLGVGKSLNIGITAAKGKYIARHDSDDISLPHRLEKLHSYMEEKTDIAICCSSVNNIDMGGNIVGQHKMSTDSHLLVAELLLNCRICTPSIIIRKEVLQSVGGFPPIRNAEDYQLFLKLAEQGYKFGAVDEVLLDYRINTESLTRKHRNTQLQFAEAGSYDYVSNLLGRQLKRDAFERFWYFVALEGRSDLSLSDVYQMRPIFKLLKNDSNYRKAWLSVFKWISVEGLEHKFSFKGLLIALYFKFLI